MENYFVKIQGKANIPTALAIGHNYVVMNDCSITSEQRVDNNDGTFDVIYKAEPLTMTIQKDNGETVKAKDPRKNSVKIRNMLWKEFFNDTGGAEDFDKVYEQATWVILSMMPTIYREAIRRIENKND